MTTNTHVCPNCGAPATSPIRVTLFGPLAPFDSWQCADCFTPLRFRLLSYYAWCIVGFVPVALYLILLAALGQADTLFTFGAIPIMWVSLAWFPSRVAAVEAAL